MEFSVAAIVTDHELVDNLFYEDPDDVIKLITDIDLRWGETDFTVKLIGKLVDSLRREGMTVQFSILEG